MNEILIGAIVVIVMVEKYMEHAKNTLVEITSLRSKTINSSLTNDKTVSSINAILSALSGIMLATKDYPNLKANETFTHIYNIYKKYMTISYNKDLFVLLKNFDAIAEYYQTLNLVIGIIEDFKLNIRIWSKQMVRLAGFEPATTGAETQCYIQLSHRRMISHMILSN